MTNQELLQTLQRIHAVTASGIISLRDTIQNDEAYTDAAKAVKQEKIKQQIGTGQVLADHLPDYREFAPEDIKEDEAEE